MTTKRRTRDTIALDLRCTDCAGEGGNEVPRCYQPGCGGPEQAQGCLHTRWEWEECEACDGTGVARCTHCDNRANTIDENGDLSCNACACGEGEGEAA